MREIRDILKIECYLFAPLYFCNVAVCEWLT